jgi:RimJ/RimL family protein N-acetyltransferase/predicted kinase
MTDAVRLRRYAPGDAPALHAAAVESQPDLHPFMPWCHPGYSLEEARAYVDSRGPAFEEEREFGFVIEDLAGRFLGSVELNQVDPAYRRANLGYWVRSSATGRGVAPAAVRRIARFAFRDTFLQRLEIVCAVSNVRSRRVAEKAGARFEGIARDRLRLHDRHHDAAIYSLVRPRLFILCGLAFAGKTTLRRELCARRGIACVSLDEINDERGAGCGGDGLPAATWARTLEIALERAGALMDAGRDLLIDDTGCFRWLRDRWRALAAEHGHTPVVVFLDTPHEEIRARMERSAATGDRRGLRPDVLAAHVASFEPPGPDEEPVTLRDAAAIARWLA